ncbi:MAG: hypothetical protein WC536_01800 [Patescibacteria group bacterium]
MKKILLGLTTTPGSDWREKVKEIDELGIKEIALFPTFLKHEERKILYNLLEKSKIKLIPHVHIRTDMDVEEVIYLKERFGSYLFNTHANPEWINKILEYKKANLKIFLENTSLLCLQEIEKHIREVDGLCLDYSHWKSKKLLREEDYDLLMKRLVDHNKIGCCHISAIYNKPKEMSWSTESPHYSGHYMYKLSDLDYMKSYVQYLPEIISIELENSFEEQLKAKEYVEKLITMNGQKQPI